MFTLQCNAIESHIYHGYIRVRKWEGFIGVNLLFVIHILANKSPTRIKI